MDPYAFFIKLMIHTNLIPEKLKNIRHYIS